MKVINKKQLINAYKNGETISVYYNKNKDLDWFFGTLAEPQQYYSAVFEGWRITIPGGIKQSDIINYFCAVIDGDTTAARHLRG